MAVARVVALLRGVNIGKRQLSMASLRAGLETAGCTDVSTYVQSGNVVLTVPSGHARDTAAWLGGVIADVAGFHVPVVVRTARQMAGVVARNPYPDAGGATLHVVFCSAPPPESVLDVIDLGAVAPEHATLSGPDVYLHLPDGMGRAKLPALLERQLKTATTVGTARNWNTVERLVAMCEP